jgi:hypothetical protein
VTWLRLPRPEQVAELPVVFAGSPARHRLHEVDKLRRLARIASENAEAAASIGGGDIKVGHMAPIYTREVKTVIANALAEAADNWARDAEQLEASVTIQQPPRLDKR